MNIITLDFECFYSDEYTLKKMTTEAYVRDPRFEVHGVGIRWPNGNLEWRSAIDLCHIPEFNAREMWNLRGFRDNAVLCHHAQFDGLILNHHYGFKPAFWLDTLSMARMLIGNHMSVGLGSLAKHYGLQDKSIDYDAFKGLHWNEMSFETQAMLSEGCLHDVELTWQIFGKLMRGEV